jgi:hypothetical protein
MWDSRLEILKDESTHKYQFDRGGTPASCSQVFEAWQDDEEFRSVFRAALARAPFSAFRWETPPVTSATISQPFECVVLDSPWLATPPDTSAFADHFDSMPHRDVIAFPNLSGDAHLIVPCPRGSLIAYSHLAAFLREAPEEQQDSLWQLVGREMSNRIGDNPLWLSTAGDAVAWLHVRLDRRPKYYHHPPYTKMPARR